MALPFPPLQVPEHQEERGDQQRNQEERDRRAPAQVSGLDTDLVREDRQDLARVTGAALGQKVHDAQVGQCEDRVEQESDHQDRKDHRHHHVTEPLHEGAAVHLGGIDDLERHRGEARQEHDRAERERAPHVDGDAGSQRQMGLASDPYAPISPTRLSAQLMTLNCESYIHFQESTLIPMGSVNGMTTRPRMSFFPRNCWSRRKASDVPNRLLKIAATTRNTTLFWKAIQKVSISQAARKFSRPMNRATGSPTLASLTASQRENRNGAPTRSST